ncbi:MAG: NfeD family protein [Bacilli bacterium]|nr:NfeD family protein [Bacilli bacterium]
MEAWMWIIWLVVFVIAIAVEAIGTDLVSIWFAAGALVSLIISFIPSATWWIQLIVFVVISLVCLFCLRPLAHKYMRNNTVRTNIDEIIHSKGVMKARYDYLHHGEVVINGVTWTAIASKERDVLEEGDVVTVVAITGNKLIVEKIKDKE